jgi:catechol 2,3-dioxygenase-like lactoylglutathione lyase family enzyme
MEFNPLIPELSVADLAKSIRFYVDTLGFQVEYRRVESGFVFLSFQGGQLMLSQRNGDWETGSLEYPFGRVINFQFRILQLDPVLTALEGAGYPLMKAPWISWYRKDHQEVGQRECLVQDPDGYLLRFAEILGVR